MFNDFSLLINITKLWINFHKFFSKNYGVLPFPIIIDIDSRNQQTHEKISK